MSDLEFSYDSDQDVSESHSKLIEAVAQLDKGQRVKKAERSEPSLEVSEFHLVKSGISDNNAIHIQDLAQVLGKKGHHLEITRNLQSAKTKAKILHKPLEKPAADRIKRIVGFENTTKDLKKWNAIITRNRTAGFLKFPLNQPSMRLEPSNDFIKRLRLKSDLEKELAALEPQREQIEQKTDEFALTLNEVLMQRKEAAKFRAQQSYKEAKARRQNKIKSKKFHRVQRKEKVKLQLKEFEELQKTDPQAALEKLEQLDKSRAEERMSLRHKSTGQWAKNKQIRAKYDKETQQELAQQLSIGRELTQKIKKPDDSEEEDDNDIEPLHLSAGDKENPWVNTAKSESEIDEFIKGYRKYWDTQKKQDQDLPSDNIGSHEMPTKQVEISEKNLNMVPNSEEVNHNADHIIKPAESKECPVVIEVINSSSKKVNHDIPNQVTKSKRSVSSTKRNSEQLAKEVVANKKMKSQRNVLTDLVSTSAWHVESVIVEEKQTVCNPQDRKVSHTEKLNKIFVDMEEKIQRKVESKLQTIKEKYNGSTKKDKGKTRSRKNNIQGEQFDGLEMHAEKQKLSVDGPLDEVVDKNNSTRTNNELEELRKLESTSTNFDSRLNMSEVEIDPNKYINVKPKQLHTDLPDIVRGEDDVLDDSESEDKKHNIMSEAFADDDVVDDFRKEKEEEVKKSQPKDIDLTLPGWGSWGGKNIRVSSRKKKRFILKFPKDLPRRDENKGNVIIIEETNPKIKEHQVNELPYPFTSVKDYEASIRMPIGRNFVPENAHRKLIEPSIKTSMGKVIEPLNEDILVKMPERRSGKPVIKKKRETIRKKRLINNNTIGENKIKYNIK